MHRIWYCRNATLVTFLLAETDVAARAAAFAVWNDDPDDVQDVTEALPILIGPLITRLRERVPARDGSGQLFRFKDPGQAIRHWLGDEGAEELICPRCDQPTGAGYSRDYKRLSDDLQAALERIAQLEATQLGS